MQYSFRQKKNPTDEKSYINEWYFVLVMRNGEELPVQLEPVLWLEKAVTMVNNLNGQSQANRVGCTCS